jgi:hypothetical protein
MTLGQSSLLGGKIDATPPSVNCHRSPDTFGALVSDGIMKLFTS